MKVRELLQIELWSKETSRKILRSVGKLLKRAVVVLGVLVVLLVVLFLIERYWLTNGERKAAKPALVQVEELQSLLDCNCERFEIVDKQAKASVGISEQKAWTVRDHTIAGLLFLYLNEIEQAQRGDFREAQVKLFVHQRNLHWGSNPKLDEKFRQSRLKVFSAFSSGLHKELD